MKNVIDICPKDQNVSISKSTKPGQQLPNIIERVIPGRSLPCITLTKLDMHYLDEACHDEAYLLERLYTTNPDPSTFTEKDTDTNHV